MSKVFISVGMSLDGFLAGPNGGPKNPLGDGGTDIHQWVFNTKAFLERHGAEGGETKGHDNQIVEEIFRRAGAYIMGRRMFDEGEVNWPEDAPFRSPVFVVTHQSRDPWKRKGGTTFYFSNDTIHNALRNAKQAAGNKDVRIAGGANLIQQCLNAGLVDELRVHLAPIFLRKGVRFFDQIDNKKVKIEIVGAISSPLVTHLQYKVLRQ
jgi:dihydrofolate reductase